MSLYHPSTEEPQGNWKDGVTTVEYTSGEITDWEVKRFFLMIALEKQSLVDSISFSQINELELLWE